MGLFPPLESATPPLTLPVGVAGWRWGVMKLLLLHDIFGRVRTRPWKQKFTHELVRYFVNVVYLAVFFGAFAWYRRFILYQYQITYLNYGTAIIEALVLAKVIWIGELIGLDHGQENKPLIYPTIYKAFVFTLFVGLFAVIEHMVGGFIRGIGVSGGLAELWRQGKYELLARCIVTFLAFIPFFAFRELAKVLGEGKLRKLFFKDKALPEFGAPA